MNDLFETTGKKLPYKEAPEYVDRLLERCRLNALEQAPQRRKKRVRHLWTTVTGVAAVAATVTLKLVMASGGNADASALYAECCVESVESSAPLSEVLASMTDDQLADVVYYTTDDIPEY